MPLLISTGNIIITPQNRVALAGFPDRQGVFDAVGDELEINLIVIRENENYQLVYSIDAFLVSTELVLAIIEKYGEQYGIKEENVWLCASHTHFAPALEDTKPMLGKYSEAYFEDVKTKILQLTHNVLSSEFTQANVVYCEGVSKLNVNRRKRLLRFDNGRLRLKTLMYPNYTGEVDDSLKAIKFMSSTGNLKAILWNYGCHPVHCVDRNNVSSDYIGAIRKSIRKKYNDNTLTVGFLQGLAGDVKADISVVTNTKKRDRLMYLLQLWPIYTKFPSKRYYDKWIELLWCELELCIDSQGVLINKAKIGQSIIKVNLSELLGSDKRRQISFRKFELSEDFILLGISAEIVAEYRHSIDNLFPHKKLVIATCLDNTSIYLPTDTIIKEGGYEVDGFKSLFGIEGKFQESIVQKVGNIIEKLKNLSDE